MNGSKKFFTLFILSIVVSSQISCVGQSQEKEYAIIMLNFARGIQWPDASSKKFTIGVLNYPPLVAELNQVFTAAKLGNKKIEILEYSSTDDIDHCEMLFVPAFKSRSFEAILTKVGSKPILILTNKADMARKGSGVNFIFSEGKLNYEINCRTIEKRGLKIPASIKGSGIVIE